MRRIKNLLAVGAFSLLVLGIPAAASAQWGGGNNNGGYNNGGYNNGGYGNNSGYSGDTRQAVKDLKRNAKDFQRQIDRDLDNSRYNGSRREDQMNQLARDFKDAVNRLDSNAYYDNNGGYNNGGYGNNGRYNNNNDQELRQVFDVASNIERTIGRAGLSYNSENIWSNIRNDLQVLGRGYNYNNNRRNNGGWGNGRGNNNGGWNKPSWWPF